MKLGIVKEIRPDERRVAAAPSTVGKWVKAGWEVVVEAGAGVAASFPDALYRAAGATIADTAAAVWLAADVVCKVRPPGERADGTHEADSVRAGQVLISFIYPAQNQALVDRLAARKATVLAMDCIPRISRAQKVDALSSMANISGYRAVVEAAQKFGSFFTGQITAAGKVAPAKVLVIGTGVAGLAALGAAKGLGAIVRAFDVRAAAADQVKSMGAEFLTVEIAESGEGQGGYAREMSKEFIDAEMALFRKQAAEVNIVITTALIPGKPAPKLWLADMVEAMKPGSVVVDLAAEAGGNCDLTVPGQAIEHNGVHVIGYTDLPSRMANVASELYGTNLWHLLDELGGVGKWKVNHGNDIVRGALVVDGGTVTWPPPKPPAPPPAPPPAATAPAPKVVKGHGHGHGAPPGKPVPGAVLIGILAAFAGAFLGLRYGMSSTHITRETAELLQHLTVFVLAVFVGWQVVWNVTPALHTPLMSVTNAVSGIIVVGGLLGAGDGKLTTAAGIAIAAVLFATINIAGGFWVTRRMLAMFRKSERAVPLVAITLAYLVAAALFILALRGLSTQESARRGNQLGIAGMAIAIVATLLIPEYHIHPLLAVAVLGGGALGATLAMRVGMTQMPELVALLHSFVGVAAVLVGFSLQLAATAAGHAPPRVELIEVYLDVIIGAITITGSILAFLKLRGSVSGKPLLLPVRHFLNLGMLTAIVVFGVLYAKDGHTWALAGGTAVACVLGVHLVAAIGGADMPVVVSMLNSYSGWTAAAAGFMLGNDLLIVTGALVGSSGAILSYIMCKAMNRSIWNVIFGGFGADPPKAAAGGPAQPAGEVQDIDQAGLADRLLDAHQVVIVPGYGMAVARAQHAVRELTEILRGKNIGVRFAIHPVAGRLPGHMNVLLAEASVPYDIVLEMDEINGDLPATDVVIVIGANDIVNPGAEDDPASPIYGMPVLQVWKSKLVVVNKRSRAAGYAGVDNPLFYKPVTRMLFGDAKSAIEKLVTELRSRD